LILKVRHSRLSRVLLSHLRYE